MLLIFFYSKVTQIQTVKVKDHFTETVAHHQNKTVPIHTLEIKTCYTKLTSYNFYAVDLLTRIH